ncbi:MAG: HAMP domain-containing protein [Candidatus Nanopelagicales bacterium]
MRWRLVAVLVGFTALVLLIQNVPLASYVRSVERENIKTLLQRDAFILAGWAIEPLSKPDPKPDPALSLRVDTYAKDTGGRVVVTDQDGVAIASSEGRVGEDYRNRVEIRDALTGDASAGERPSESLGEPLVYAAVPVRVGNDVLGSVRITYPSSEIDARVSSRVRALTIAALITLLTAALIALIVATTVTRRIRRLRDAAEEIAEGDLDARADVSGGGEIHELAEAFNTMADRVQGVVESQRGFAGDASHQLRTPLTALRLRLDRAADLMPDEEPALEQVDAARDEIDRMQRLVDGLLVLARAENREQQTMQVDVAQIAADRVDAWQPLADERAITITLDAPPVALAHAVASAPEQIIDNYLDNALEAVPDGGLVVVAVRGEQGSVLVTVDDSGPGLPAEDRERAFDRFWRGSQDGGGSGLGLAVVASLAHAGGGSVHLEESPLGGVRACARFRRTPPGTPTEPRTRGAHAS